MPNHPPTKWVISGRGSGTKMCHQFTKSLTVDLSQVVRCEIPGWGQMIWNDSWLVITTQLYLPLILSPSIHLYIPFLYFWIIFSVLCLLRYLFYYIILTLSLPDLIILSFVIVVWLLESAYIYAKLCVDYDWLTKRHHIIFCHFHNWLLLDYKISIKFSLRNV